MSKKFYELSANDEVTVPTDIAALPASAITSGTFDTTRIPSLAASKITSGTLGTARIPSLDASKIASGTLGSARLPLANGSSKGAVNPSAKTSAMTQEVGVDTSTGKLYTNASGGGGGSSGHTVTFIGSYGEGGVGQYIHVVKADGTRESYSWSEGETKTITVSGVVAFSVGKSLGSNPGPFPDNSILSDGGQWYAGSMAQMLAFVFYDCTYSFSTGCFIRGTLITLADGTQKPIEDITHDDNILVWNFDEGKFDTAKPYWIKRGETADHYWVNTFESGRVVKSTGEGYGHRFFDADKGAFVPNTECGECFNVDGKPDRLVKCEYVEEPCEYYNIITAKHFNCFTNGILTSSKMNNLYPIVDMKFVKDERSIVEKKWNWDREMVSSMRFDEQPMSIEEVNSYAERMIKGAK